MIVVLFILLASVIVSIVAFIAYKKQNNPQRMMREGKLLKSEHAYPSSGCHRPCPQLPPHPD